MGFFHKNGEHYCHAGKGSCHVEAGRETAGLFSENAGYRGTGDLAKPEDEGDETESSERFINTYILAYSRDHDRWDRPCHDAVEADGEV